MAPRRLLLGSAVLVLLLVAASPALAAPSVAGPLVCVDQHCRGYLSVPLDSTGAVSGHVELYVSEWIPAGTPKGAVFLLAGGPGQSSSAVWRRPDSLWAGYTQIVYDDRGTGLSSRIACGPFVGDDDQADVTRCSDQLGAERAFYSTRANAADMDAIRRALGFAKVSVEGTSYGTKQALAFAQEYPAAVDRLLLDSTLVPAGPDVYDMQLGTSVPAGLKALCANGVCARATSDPAGDMAAVANALALAPFDGTVKITKGAATPARLSANDVVSLAVATDLSSEIVTLLPSALRAAREGRPAELERLWTLETWGSRDVPDQSDYFSEPIFVATTCDDGEFPWPAGTAVAARQPLLDRALTGLAAGSFGLLGSWLERAGPASMCLGWQSTGLSPLASTGFPDVPVLIVSGDRDIRTPTANALAVAKLFPRASVLVVHGSGHSVLGGTECADAAASAWLGGALAPGQTECDSGESQFVLPAIPASLASARPLAPGGKIGRTLAAVVATVDELHAYGSLVEDDEIFGERGPSLVGLVSGSTDFEGLHAYSDVAGVTLAGSKSPAFDHSLKINVRGSAAARGTLTYELTGFDGECTLKGTLGGRRVSASC